MRLIIDHAGRLLPLGYGRGDSSKAADSRFVSQAEEYTHNGSKKAHDVKSHQSP